MPTIAQIRAARALLDWSQADLADHAGLSQTGIARIENGTNKPNSSTLDKIRNAFDQADIEFLGESGVRKRTGEIKTFKGQDGFRAFMDDVYETLKVGGGEITVSNVDENNWIKWMGQDAYNAHSKKMEEIPHNIFARILVREGDTFFIANSFAEYRWFPSELFNDQSIYAYKDKLALINFTEENVRVMLLNNKEFAKGFRVLFDIAWKNVATIPSEQIEKSVRK